MFGLKSSLSNFRQANVLIRIGCYAPYGNSYYIDDILIDNAPTPKALTLLTPTNNGMKVRWGISTAPDFGSYRVVLSTDQNQVNNYFNVPCLKLIIPKQEYLIFLIKQQSKQL